MSLIARPNRSARRLPVRFVMAGPGGASVVEGHTRDISAAGACIVASGGPPKVGQKLKIGVRLPTEARCSLDARVAWTQIQDAGAAGKTHLIGIEILVAEPTWRSAVGEQGEGGGAGGKRPAALSVVPEAEVTDGAGLTLVELDEHGPEARARRIPVRLPLSVGYVDGTNGLGVTKDLSAHGLAFVSAVARPVGSSVSLRVQLPSKYVIHVGGRVARVTWLSGEKDQQHQQHLVCVRLEQIPPEWDQLVEAVTRVFDRGEGQRRATPAA